MRLLWLVALVGCSGPENGPILEPPVTTTGDTAVEAPFPDADAGEDRFVVPGEPFLLDAGELPADVTATWTRSDGQILDGNPVEATLDTPGHYTVVLELSRSERDSTDAATLTAVYEPLTPAPSQSTPMFLREGTLYAAVRDLDEVVAIDVATGAVEARYATCHDPRALVWSPDDLGFLVACRGDDRVQRHDLAGGVDELALPWGAAPMAMVVAGARVLVQGGARGEVYVLDGLDLVDRWPLLVDGRALALVPEADGSGELLAPRFRAVGLHGDLFRQSLGSDGGASGSAEVLELAPDPGPDSDTNARGIPNLVQSVAVSPDGRQVAVAGLKANLQRGLVRDGLGLTFETTVRADLRLLSRDPGTGALAEVDAVLFDDRDRVAAIAWSERGEWLYAAHGGMELIDVIDPFTAQRAGVSTPVGGLVDGLLVDGSQLWALSSLGRAVVRYDLSQPSFPVETLRVDLTPAGGEPWDAELLLGKRWFHRSNDLRLNAGGYVACASCHPDGEHDGQTWDFTDRGEGLRSTLPLVGRAGVGMGPLHWSANFDEPHDFEHDIRGPQAGRGLMDDADFTAADHPLGAPKAGLSEDLDALAAYMDSLDSVPRSPYRADDGSLTAEAEAGRLIFEDPARRCIECHPAPSYTDSGWLDDGKGGRVPNLHDVGTLTAESGQRLGVEVLWGVDTPTLRGTGVTGPWGHRGQAERVTELFPVGDVHGVTSDLGAAEMGALEAFVMQIE